VCQGEVVGESSADTQLMPTHIYLYPRTLALASNFTLIVLLIYRSVPKDWRGPMLSRFEGVWNIRSKIQEFYWWKTKFSYDYEAFAFLPV
jgi:hypothetical protein